MAGITAKVTRKLNQLWEHRRQRVELAPLYAPDTSDLAA